jgi:hypothetical protein
VQNLHAEICNFVCYMIYQWRNQEFCSVGGGSTNSVEDTGRRERVSGGGSPLVRGSGGSYNLVQEISFPFYEGQPIYLSLLM